MLTSRRDPTSPKESNAGGVTARSQGPRNAGRAQLVEGAVGPMLARLTVPMIFGMLGIHAFHLADTFFVGRLGTRELAAMSFTFPVVFIVSGLSLGLGLGAGALVSKAIGEGDWDRVRRLTSDSLALSVLIVAAFVAVGLLTIGPVFRLLGATPDLIPLIRSYMSIWYPGMVFVVIPMVGNNAIRATGDTKTPSLIMIVAALVNTGLDPLFIFGVGPFPRLELAGAALATVIGRSITFAVALWVLARRERMLTLSFPGLAALWRTWRRVLFIGIPSALNNIAVPVGIGAITRIVAGYGPEAVAGFGVGSRIETFSLTVVMALRSVLAPFIGQNWGARRFDRMKLGIGLSERFALAWGAVMCVALAAWARPLARVFNDTPEVVWTVVRYLWIVPLSFGLRGIVLLSTSTLSVLRRPIDAALLTIVQFFALYVPLAIVGSRVLGIPGVFGAALVAHVVTGLLAHVWLGRMVAVRSREISE